MDERSESIGEPGRRKHASEANAHSESWEPRPRGFPWVFP
jgi:hypothetical protein